MTKKSELTENCKLYPKDCKCKDYKDRKCCTGSRCASNNKCNGIGFCDDILKGGCCLPAGHPKKQRCCNYSFVSKNPFDVAISKELEEDTFYVLLSGNHYSNSDYDKDSLPDWVAISDRPCRDYRTTTTAELIDLWHKDENPCGDICYTERSYEICHPNGYINYYLTNGMNKSQAVEILDAHMDDSETEKEPTLVLKVKLLHKSDNRNDMDGLNPNMYRVSVVIDSNITNYTLTKNMRGMKDKQRNKKPNKKNRNKKNRDKKSNNNNDKNKVKNRDDGDEYFESACKFCSENPKCVCGKKEGGTYEPYNCSGGPPRQVCKCCSDHPKCECSKDIKSGYYKPINCD